MNLVSKSQLEKSSRGLLIYFSELPDCELETEDTEKAFQVYVVEYKKRVEGKSKGTGKGGKGKGRGIGESKGGRRPSGTLKGKGRDSSKMTISRIVNGQQENTLLRKRSCVKKVVLDLDQQPEDMINSSVTKRFRSDSKKRNSFAIRVRTKRNQVNKSRAIWQVT